MTDSRKRKPQRLLTYCNCAGCGAFLLGDSWRSWYNGLRASHRAAHPPPVRGRVLGRPYCADCLAGRAPEGAPAPPEDDGGPSWQNAVRALEGE
jgi:hypothetical protein